MPRPYLVTFALSLAMVGMLSTYAHSGPNAGGTLVLHAPVPSIYTTDGGYCGSSGLTDCTGATTRFDSQDPIVVFVLASFFQDAAPRLAGVTFGLEYSDCVAVIGGDAKKIRRHVGDDSLRYYSSSHNGGNGDAAMLTAAIRAGGVD